ncbi:MAG: GNAT family N-acetyltransferase [Atribacterota bacterium]|jgi:GNAT superfamily N-acetyltransferase|nr:GNAT family N-acetyltransferase [Atribacterota bacterium]MDD3641552.1 GNAT family N-acetyltransferase [Atribacterota bacterium]MDD4289544.1 GNAT family N-acetyltransferase [Atribacterota bacterium]MDD4765718.1 GNAT family N-acetyltransferase [Atribacterota bacterium]MDI9596632.1 GNAT family N-acetyltransferase [Atribacterota bacterium]
MIDVTEVKIRGYQKEDRNAIREISIESSIFGEYRNAVFDDEVLADLLTAYFTDYEPVSCFVAEKKEYVMGYILGTKDVRKMRNVLKRKVIPGVVKDLSGKGQLFRKGNLIFIKNIVFSYFKGEFVAPDFSPEYPATLHINIAPQFRGQNVGSLLINHYLDFLKKESISGIHFGVLSERAKMFFLKLDFKVLFTGKYTFLNYLTGETLPHYIIGKKL